MTNENISELRDAIRELDRSIHQSIRELHSENNEIKSKLWNLERKVESIWFDIWAPVALTTPLILIALAIIKHL